MSLPARRYTPDDKRTGLIALLVTGSATAASEQTSIPRKTLESWRTSEPELWSALNREYSNQADEMIVTELRTSVRTAANIERQLLDRMAENITRIDPRDLPAAIKNVTAAKAQNTDKLLVLTGRANTIIEHIDARDILKDLGKMFQGQHIDSTAEEA